MYQSVVRITYLVALEPVWFHSDLEPFPVEDKNQEQLELKVSINDSKFRSLDHYS